MVVEVVEEAVVFCKFGWKRRQRVKCLVESNVGVVKLVVRQQATYVEA
jgi:hypothetical protein